MTAVPTWPAWSGIMSSELTREVFPRTHIFKTEDVGHLRASLSRIFSTEKRNLYISVVHFPRSGVAVAMLEGNILAGAEEFADASASNFCYKVVCFAVNILLKFEPKAIFLDVQRDVGFFADDIQAGFMRIFPNVICLDDDIYKKGRVANYETRVKMGNVTNHKLRDVSFCASLVPQASVNKLCDQLLQATVDDKGKYYPRENNELATCFQRCLLTVEDCGKAQ